MNANRYTISADSNRWWWSSAAAGAVATAAIAAIACGPASAGIPDIDPAPGPGSTRPVEAYVVVSHPCFMEQPRWNVGMDGPQPVCRTEIRTARESARDRSRETAPEPRVPRVIVAEPVGP